MPSFTKSAFESFLGAMAAQSPKNIKKLFLSVLERAVTQSNKEAMLLVSALKDPSLCKEEQETNKKIYHELMESVDDLTRMYHSLKS